MDLPKPHTPATVGEWAEEMLPDFIKQEREMRLAAEKVAAEKEAKRSKLRNIAKVGPTRFQGKAILHSCWFLLQRLVLGGVGSRLMQQQRRRPSGPSCATSPRYAPVGQKAIMSHSLVVFLQSKDLHPVNTVYAGYMEAHK